MEFSKKAKLDHNDHDEDNEIDQDHDHDDDDDDEHDVEHDEDHEHDEHDHDDEEIDAGAEDHPPNDAKNNIPSTDSEACSPVTTSSLSPNPSNLNTSL